MKLGLEELGVTGVDQLGGRTTWWYRLAQGVKPKAMRSKPPPACATKGMLFFSLKGRFRSTRIDATCQAAKGARLGETGREVLRRPLLCHSLKRSPVVPCRTKSARASPRFGTRPISVIWRSAQRSRTFTQNTGSGFLLEALVKSSRVMRSTNGRPVSWQ